MRHVKVLSSTRVDPPSELVDVFGTWPLCYIIGSDGGSQATTSPGFSDSSEKNNSPSPQNCHANLQQGCTPSCASSKAQRNATKHSGFSQQMAVGVLRRCFTKFMLFLSLHCCTVEKWNDHSKIFALSSLFPALRSTFWSYEVWPAFWWTFQVLEPFSARVSSKCFFDGFTSYSDPRFIQTVILQHLLLFLKGFEQRIYLFLCFIFVFFLNLFIFWIVRSWLWTTRGFVHMYIMEKNQIYNKKKHTEDSHGMQLHGGRVRLQEELSFGTCSAPCTASPWNCTQFNVTFSTAV